MEKIDHTNLSPGNIVAFIGDIFKRRGNEEYLGGIPGRNIWASLSPCPIHTYAPMAQKVVEHIVKI